MPDHAYAADRERRYASARNDGLDRPSAHDNRNSESITITDDDGLVMLLDELGIKVSSVSVLPRNLLAAESVEDFVFEQMTGTIRTLGRQVGLTIDVPGPSTYLTIREKDYETVTPVILFAHAFLIEGGAALAFKFLEQLASHVASRWGAKKAKEQDAFIEVVISHGAHAKRLTYKGPLRGLPFIADAAREAFTEKHDEG